MYRLSERYVLETRKEQGETVVVILNNNTGKFIEIPAVRWASFVLMQADIDEAVNQLLEKKAVNYFEHFGGGYYVSVSTDILCVDLRRFYKNNKGEIKPTKQGLALRISEWKELVACPCPMKERHLNDPNIILGCAECSPIGSKNA